MDDLSIELFSGFSDALERDIDVKILLLAKFQIRQLLILCWISSTTGASFALNEHETVQGELQKKVEHLETINHVF
jgi:hypothetical protein